MDRPHYVLVLRPEPGVDGLRALRALLKFALRPLGLRCVKIEEIAAGGAAASLASPCKSTGPAGRWRRVMTSPRRTDLAAGAGL
jgi:hypothetical protein